MVRNLPGLFSVVEVLVQRAVQASASVLLSDVSLHCSPQLPRQRGTLVRTKDERSRKTASKNNRLRRKTLPYWITTRVRVVVPFRCHLAEAAYHEMSPLQRLDGTTKVG
jgi:hypothetical protein